MTKNKKIAYLLLALGIILITISVLIGIVFDNTTFTGIMTGNQIILEIIYYGLNFGAFICVILGVFLLIKNKESVYND